MFDSEKRRINIDSILTPEVGHAFGLNNVTENGSIMTPYIQVTQPSDHDVDRPAEQLLTAVKDDSAGIINFTTDNAVSSRRSRKSEARIKGFPVNPRPRERERSTSPIHKPSAQHASATDWCETRRACFV